MEPNSFSRTCSDQDICVTILIPIHKSQAPVALTLQGRQDLLSKAASLTKTMAPLGLAPNITKVLDMSIDRIEAIDAKQQRKPQKGCHLYTLQFVSPIGRRTCYWQSLQQCGDLLGMFFVAKGQEVASCAEVSCVYVCLLLRFGYLYATCKRFEMV